MTGTYSSEPVLDGLKGFQRATVDHVTRRFYADDPAARRFLVADETGLGKSLVARGVIARCIEHLQHEPSVDRIDVIYVCSNADIAEQNLKRLDVLKAGTQHQRTRLTLLARDSGNLTGEPHPEVGKRVNLVSFTPGTSFNVKEGTGQAQERALLHVVLCQQLGYRRRSEQKAAAVVLRSYSGHVAFEREITRTQWLLEGREPDPAITAPFLELAGEAGLIDRFAGFVAEVGRRTVIPDGLWYQHQPLIGHMRHLLARAGVEALEPDLVILDEFQRFRHLLATDDSRYQEAAELAEALFTYGDAKVLLLSATPYKAFTYAEEARAGDDHETDLRRTLGFLAAPDKSAVDGIVHDLAAFRRAAVDGAPTQVLRDRLRVSLTQLMCRTERPRLGDDGMLKEIHTSVEAVQVDDVVAYARLEALADALDAPVSIDYWKSTPYFVNFGDGYKLGDKLRAALKDPVERARLGPHLRRTQHLDAAAVKRRDPIDPGNARMRRLVDDTVGQGWWQLLWVPPSLPYGPPGGPFALPALQAMTKRLVFSSWAATPTAIASLVSHEANRQIAIGTDTETATAARLGWRLEGDRPGAMTTLALFWPSPTLARSVAPFDGAEREPAPLPPRATGAEPWYWTTLFADKGSLPADVSPERASAALAGSLDADGEDDDSTGLGAHVRLAFDLQTGAQRLADERRTSAPGDIEAVLEELGRFAPGNVAYRCVERLVNAGDATTEAGRWEAAATIAGGLRNLFNRPDSILTLDRLLPDAVYWRAVLRYCAWGNLEAVLDEYLHHLSATERQEGLDDARLLSVAEAVRAAITIRPSRYEAFDPLHQQPISFPSRIALRYGNKRAGADEGARQPEIRAAFNSPFWPFVLATTSVGQEGIDFHWWCHAAVHWNVPASPVDFEQREGRVHRFGGHAIRRNLAEMHGSAILGAAQGGEQPWDAAYRLGVEASSDEFGDLSPFWITEGSTKIERHVLPYPLSQDHERYRRLKDDLAIYRLTFGQPRQEDLAEILKQRGVQVDPDELEALRLELNPPSIS